MHVAEFDWIADVGNTAALYACPECGAAVADRLMVHELASNRLAHIYWHEQRGEG